MRKLILIVTAFIVTTLFWSCENDDADLLGLGGIVKDTTIIAKPPFISSISFRTDWEIYDTIHDLQGEVIRTPWSDDGAPGAFSEDRTDIKKEDGWRFVYSLMEGEKKDKRNYVILYNEITGILKVFCYCRTANDNHNNTFWFFSFLDKDVDRTTGKLLYAAGDVAIPYNVDVNNTSEYKVSASDAFPNRAITNGWNVAKIPLSYDPGMITDYKLSVKSLAYTESYLSLFADFNSETNGKAVASYGASMIPNFRESLVKTSENATKNWLEGQSALKKLPKLLSDLATASPAALVADGVNLLGSSFFGLFSKPQQTSYVIELTTNTHGNIEGTLTKSEETGLTPCTLPMRETNIKTKLGSWNLSDFPTIYVHPVALKISKNPSYNECQYQMLATGNFKCDVVFNPELEKHIISKEIECEPLYYYNYSDSVKPQRIVHPSYNGTIGDRNSYGLKPTRENIIYYENSSSYVMKNELVATSTFWGPIDIKTKNEQNKGFWDYIYVPKQSKYSHYPIMYNMEDIFAKVTVKLKVKYEDMITTAIMTRTYSPKIEWDPEQVKIYENMSIEDLQEYAKYDHIVNRKE